MMFSFFMVIILVLLIMATAHLGLLLFLHEMTMMSDAISHAMLPGIVVMFLLIGTVDSGWLLCGAVLTGGVLIFLAERLMAIHSFSKDSAVGLIYPLLFSIGVILINYHVNHIHLDVDVVLLGEIIFAPLYKWYVGTWCLGPSAIWLLLLVGFINRVVLMYWFDRALIVIFDPSFAGLLGISRVVVYYVLMGLTCITSVLVFHVVGATGVVGFFVLPAVIASTWSVRVSESIYYQYGIAFVGSLVGYMIALLMDISVIGSMMTVFFGMFLISLAWFSDGGFYKKWQCMMVNRYHIFVWQVIVLLNSSPEDVFISDIFDTINIGTVRLRMYWIVGTCSGWWSVDHLNVVRLEQKGRRFLSVWQMPV